MDGGNGCFYGIPFNARQVVEFNVEDKSIKEIGPDLGDGGYLNGIKANNGSIYCMPCNAEYFLKIIPGEGQNTEVQILREMQLPRGDWDVGALANDGCTYYFPIYRGCILKLDPNDVDSLSLVGEDINKGFQAAVLGNDGYIYGIYKSRVVKFSLTDQSVSCIGRSFDDYYFWTGAVLTEDGNIYAVNHCGQILHIDTSENDWKIIGSKIYNDAYFRWGSPVLGADKCIYYPSAYHDRVLKFNPSTQIISLIGDCYRDKDRKWEGVVLASDGYIYCIPYDANDILQIDSRHVNEQVIGMIEKLQRNDRDIIENATEVKKRKWLS